MASTNPITQTVGRNIAKARKHRGWTQKQLGEKIGVSETAVRFWESARREISHDSLLAVGRELAQLLHQALLLCPEVHTQHVPGESNRARVIHRSSSCAPRWE